MSGSSGTGATGVVADESARARADLRPGACNCVLMMRSGVAHVFLRENPHDRDRIFKLYQDYLTHAGLPFAIIEGVGVVRMNKAIEVIEKMLP